MRILVTGSRGMIGRETVARLASDGHDVSGFDVVDGADVLDTSLLDEAAQDREVIVHLAALDAAQTADSPFGPLGRTSTTDERALLQTNIGGTFNVLRAAERAGALRVVFLSSVDVYGCFSGQGAPAYLPIDDRHPLEPKGPYAWSKVAGEHLCEAFTAATGASSVCLRAPGVFTAATYDFIRAARAETLDIEWDPYWEYGAFIDVRDLATAIGAAVSATLRGHHRLVVNANDISSAHEESLTLASRLAPETPLRDPERYRLEPYAALIDSSTARALLDWAPVHDWRTASESRIA